MLKYFLFLSSHPGTVEEEELSPFRKCTWGVVMSEYVSLMGLWSSVVAPHGMEGERVERERTVHHDECFFRSLILSRLSLSLLSVAFAVCFLLHSSLVFYVGRRPSSCLERLYGVPVT